LSRAAEKGDEGVVKLLLENGAQPDFEDENHQTPLSRAVEGGSVAIIQLLLSQEAKMDHKYCIVSELHPYLQHLLG
jgi:ankyrin repeat protein